MTTSTITTLNCNSCNIPVTEETVLYLENESFCIKCALQSCAKHYAKHPNNDDVAYMREIAKETDKLDYFNALFSFYSSKTVQQKPVYSIFNLLNQTMLVNNSLLESAGIEYVLETDAETENIIILEYNHRTNQTTQICDVESSTEAYILYLQAVALSFCEIV